MSGAALADAAPGRPGPARSIRRVLASVGTQTIAAARWVAFVAGLGAAVAGHAVRPRSWRRPVRAALMLAIHEAGVRAIPAVLVAAVLVGIGMVFQALYWLGSVGQETLIGPLLTTILVREVAPVVVGLLVLGRTGTATLIVLGGHVREGRVAALDAQGVEPLLLLVMPRVIASAIAGLTLTIIFVAAALLAGWGVAALLNPVAISLPDFLGNVMRSMGASNFVLLPLKGILIGLVVSLVACGLVFGSPGLAASPTRLLPQGFALMVLAALLASGIVSMVL